MKTEMSNDRECFTQIVFYLASVSNNASHFYANSPHAIVNNGTIKENQEGDRDV